MSFNKSTIVNIALISLVVLSLSTNVLLYLQLQRLQDRNTALETRLDSLQAEMSNLNSKLSQIQESANKTVHTKTLRWLPQHIDNNSRVEGYIKEWTTNETIRILQVDVWMGNPYNITWEGDVFVTLNNSIDPWDPPTDAVIVHYQFDSHASSPIPHLLSFDIRPGFLVDSGKTLYIYRLFHNFDEKGDNAGDGWVRFYYTIE